MPHTDREPLPPQSLRAARSINTASVRWASAVAGGLFALIMIASCAAYDQSLHTAALLQPETPQEAFVLRGVEGIQEKYGLRTVQVRLEQPGQVPLEVAVGGGATGALLPVASISKSVTGIGIALLIQQGRLRLDSTLGELLTGYFARRGQMLDSSLQNITIERLLTHTAGLRANYATDPVNGARITPVLRRISDNNDFFDFLMASGGARSNGSTSFTYSNFSYLFLGIVIEAVTGQKYSDFCYQNIFRPLGVTDATLPGLSKSLAPFSGWYLSLADVLKLWSAFDIQHPSILTDGILNRTLLGKLGPAQGTARNVHYAFGAYVRQDRPGGAYVLEHNGIADYFRPEPATYTFVEKFVPGYAWAEAHTAFSGQEEELPAVSHKIATDTRSVLKEMLHDGSAEKPL